MTITPLSPQQFVTALQDFVDRKIDEGWKVYMLTFMFNRLGGSRSTVLLKMNAEVSRIYSTMLTRIVRRPHSARASGRLPIWFVSPDFPVPKNEKKSLREVSVNDGLHLHAIALISAQSRVRKLAVHVQENQGLYVKDGSVVCRVDAKRIRTTAAKAVAYSMKAITRRRCGADDVVIFPRAATELS